MHRLALTAALLIAPAAAEAGACCMGATTTLPARVGPCEKGIALVSVVGEAAIGRWDNATRSRPTALRETGVLTTVGLGVGLTRRWQLGATLPGRWNQRRIGDQQSTGLGFGDVRVQALHVLREGRPRVMDTPARPDVLLGFGLRLPTGRSWHRSDDALLADVTGLPGPAGTFFLGVEQTTTGDLPWFVGLSGEVGGLRRQVFGLFTATGGVGQYLGNQWTILGLLSHTATIGAFQDALGHAAATTAGLRVVTGRTLAWRGWINLSVDLPIPGLGRDRQQLFVGGGGIAAVW